MRHRKAYRTLGMDCERRKHLLRNQAISLIEYGKIVTTEAKAKETVKFVSKLITMAKINNLAARRRVLSKINNNKKITKKLFDELLPKFADKNGGYVRMIRLGFRKGDAAKIALIEFVE